MKTIKHILSILKNNIWAIYAIVCTLLLVDTITPYECCILAVLLLCIFFHLQPQRN